jgi:AcrR family transcriptional regulator
VRSKKQPVGEDGRTFVDIARRAQLVRCAIDAIAEVGYQRASLAEIARRAGITKGAIFYHFANRDELIEAVFAEVITAGRDFMLPRIQTAETPREQLRAYVSAFVEALDVDPKAIQVLYTIGQQYIDEEGRSKFLYDPALQEAALAPLQDILRRGQEAGQFGEFSVRSMAMMMRATLEAIPTFVTAYPDLDLTTYGQDLITFFERACSTTQPIENDK